MDNNRKTAYHTLMDIETKKSYSNLALNHHIKVSRPKDPAFVRELVYGVLENKMYLDYFIDKLVDHGIESVHKQDLTILRMGLYQLDKMDSVPEYAAVNESVALAKRCEAAGEGLYRIDFTAYRYGYSPDIVQDKSWYGLGPDELIEAMRAAYNPLSGQTADTWSGTAVVEVQVVNGERKLQLVTLSIA